MRHSNELRALIIGSTECVILIIFVSCTDILVNETNENEG